MSQTGDLTPAPSAGKPFSEAGTAFKLTDALTHLRGLTDQNHKYWAYFQVLSGAVITLGWTGAKGECVVAATLVALYLLFAAASVRVLWHGQRAARDAWGAVQEYIKRPRGMDERFVKVLGANKPDSAYVVAIGQLVLAAVTAWLVYQGGQAEPAKQYVCAPVPPK